jgi:hypothetical protein
MSSSPLSRDYQVKSTVVPGEFISSSGKPLGQQLFDDITEFYSWYISSWYMADGKTASVEILQKNESIRKILSLLKRIAEVSMNGGSFLREKEEIHVLNKLSNILQDLNSGKLRKHHLPNGLFQVLEGLTQNNPKAKVISQITELEYYFCINPPPGQSPESTIRYQKLFNQIIDKISPQMPDISASAIAQGLSRILESLNSVSDLASKASFATPSVKNIYQEIQEAIRHWL